LRELHFIVEGYKQPWIAAMMTLLVEAKTAVEAVQLKRDPALSLAQLTDFTQRYQTLLEDGFKANPPLPVDDLTPKQRGRVKQSPPKN
jgi:hypothetical protein